MASVYKDSPFGPVDYPHLNRPDDKFNKDNPLYKGAQRLTGEVAEKFAAEIIEASDKALADFLESEEGQKLTPKQRKEFAVYYPFEREEDDEGEPTGFILFDFKQNSVIRLKDGTTKEVKIGLYDAAGNEMDKLVRHGSVVRFRYAMRPITMKSLKQVGVRLDFAMVQVKELAQGGSQKGFDAVDGYEDDGVSTGGAFGSASEGSSDGDY